MNAEALSSQPSAIRRNKPVRLVFGTRIYAVRDVTAHYFFGTGTISIGANTEGQVTGHRDGEVVVQFAGLPKQVLVPVAAIKPCATELQHVTE